MEKSNEKLPDVLYKYIHISNAIKIIENQSLWFSSPKEFNDPFDCNINLIDFTPRMEDIKSFLKENFLRNRETVRQEIQKNRRNPYRIKNQMAEQIQEDFYKSGVCCFSEINSNNLMWSHYADNHKGICLKFSSAITDIATMATKVNYKSGYEKVNFWTGKGSSIAHLIFTKSNEWHYEKEIRLFRMLDNGKVPFDINYLTEIIFGCKTDSAMITKVKEAVLKSGFKHIKFRQAKQTKSSFLLRID